MKSGKKQFNLIAYAVAMEDHDRALTIAKELKERYVITKDNTLASIFEKIENAITSEKNKEYEKAKISWDEASKSAKGVDEKISVLAKAFYYGILATSAKDIEVELEYRKKAKKEIQKSEDKILVLFASAEIAVEDPKKQAELYEKVADEFKEIGYERNYHLAMGWHYDTLADITESPKERAELEKKSADEFKEGEVEDLYHWAMGYHYYALASATESLEERAELHKKSAGEFKEGKEEDLYHRAMGWHYYALASATESLEERAELNKKSAGEFKEGKEEDLYHWAMGWHYYALASATESLEERAELKKKSAGEFKEGKEEDLYHWAMGWHYSALASATESLEERAELHKKAAEEFKAGKRDKLSHQAMAWHYYLLSLQSEVEEQKEDFKLKAVEETDRLFIANIALSLSKISKKPEKIIYLITDAISSYENYLHEKGEKLPKFPIFIDGNFRDEKTVEDITKRLKSYFVPEISPFLKNKPVEVEELDNMIENSEFILMLVENNVGEKLSFEMGLAYTAGKPVVLFVPGDISNLNPIFSKAATITQKLEYANTVLRLFSIIKSGEILEVGKDEREKRADFLKFIKKIEIPQPKIEFKPSFIEEKMPLKQKYGRLRGDKV